jgi:DNA repair exonuclease SbcCD ATPase subunit
VAQTANDLKAIMTALSEFIQRLNAPRKVSLLKEEITQTRTEIESLALATQQLSSMNEEYRQLCQHRESLLIEKANINDLNRQKEEIQQLQAFVAKYDTSELQQELQQLKNGATSHITQFNAWLNEASLLLPQLQGSFIEQTKALLSKVEEIRRNITAALAESKLGLENECTSLSGLLQEYDPALNEVNTRYNALVHQLTAIKTRLLELKNKHAINIALYELHFAQNKNIYGELGKHHQLDQHVEGLCSEIQGKLRRFDSEIKELVEKADHLTIF